MSGFDNFKPILGLIANVMECFTYPRLTETFKIFLPEDLIDSNKKVENLLKSKWQSPKNMPLELLNVLYRYQKDKKCILTLIDFLKTSKPNKTRCSDNEYKEKLTILLDNIEKYLNKQKDDKLKNFNIRSSKELEEIINQIIQLIKEEGSKTREKMVDHFEINILINRMLVEGAKPKRFMKRFFKNIKDGDLDTKDIENLFNKFKIALEKYEKTQNLFDKTKLEKILGGIGKVLSIISSSGAECTVKKIVDLVDKYF